MIPILFRSALFQLTATPTPAPFDEDSVTPGWIGFVAIFLIGIATLALGFDMVRRMRRARYRGEIREQLEAEQAAADSQPAKEDSPACQ